MRIGPEGAARLPEEGKTVSASKKLRREATIRKRKEDRILRRDRDRRNAAEAAARREEARMAPRPERAAHAGLLPASMALAAMALVGTGL